jgi:hypothetical protein
MSVCVLLCRVDSGAYSVHVLEVYHTVAVVVYVVLLQLQSAAVYAVVSNVVVMLCVFDITQRTTSA